MKPAFAPVGLGKCVRTHEGMAQSATACVCMGLYGLFSLSPFFRVCSCVPTIFKCFALNPNTSDIVIKLLNPHVLLSLLTTLSVEQCEGAQAPPQQHQGAEAAAGHQVQQQDGAAGHQFQQHESLGAHSIQMSGQSSVAPLSLTLSDDCEAVVRRLLDYQQRALIAGDLDRYALLEPYVQSGQ